MVMLPQVEEDQEDVVWNVLVFFLFLVTFTTVSCVYSTRILLSTYTSVAEPIHRFVPTEPNRGILLRLSPTDVHLYQQQIGTETFSVGGRKSEGVSVMKDKVKVEEIETPLTLGESGEGRVQGRGKWSMCRFNSAVRHT